MSNTFVNLTPHHRHKPSEFTNKNIYFNHVHEIHTKGKKDKKD
jgi:hypothetical protein